MPDAETWRLLAVLFAATLLITLMALGASTVWGMPAGARGTLMQSAFRGNLAYIGIPVLAYSSRRPRLMVAIPQWERQPLSWC